MGAAPYQMLFLHLLIWSCDFCLSFWLYDVSHLLIFKYCTILASRGWTPLDLSNVLLYDLLTYCWIQFANILLGILASMFISNSDTNSKSLCTPIFIAAQFIIAKCWKQPKCPSVNEWIKKLWYIYTMEYYMVERKKELLSFATAWMGFKSTMLSEISQAVKDKWHMISHISWTWATKQTSEQTRTRVLWSF